MSTKKDSITLDINLAEFTEIEQGNKTQLLKPLTDYWTARLNYNGYKTVIFANGRLPQRKTIEYNLIGIERDYKNLKWYYLIKW